MLVLASEFLLFSYFALHAECRERELAKVKVDEAHVKLIAGQFAVPVRYTRRKLRENGGDPVKTMLAFVNQKEPLPLLD